MFFESIALELLLDKFCDFTIIGANVYRRRTKNEYQYYSPSNICMF